MAAVREEDEHARTAEIFQRIVNAEDPRIAQLFEDLIACLSRRLIGPGSSQALASSRSPGFTPATPVRPSRFAPRSSQSRGFTPATPFRGFRQSAGAPRSPTPLFSDLAEAEEEAVEGAGGAGEGEDREEGGEYAAGGLREDREGAGEGGGEAAGEEK